MADHSIPTPALSRWTVDLFLAAGSSGEEARLAADHLVGANLAGHDSHGVGMVPRYVNSLLEDGLQLNRRIEVPVDTGSMLICDGMRGLGQSVAHQAMALAIERARQHGVVAMGLRNAHHIGRVGHWAEQATAAGMVSVHFVNAIAFQVMVAPHRGAQPRFLTNPFTVGIPRPGGEPILLDFATSAIAQGKVRVAYNKKVEVPAGSLIDADGRPTRDPAVMFERRDGAQPSADDPAAGLGALVTFAEHKGYALALVCELLGAALTGGETAQPRNMPTNHAIWNNMFTLLFDPARLGSTELFGREMADYLAWVQSARAVDRDKPVLVPGDPERASRRERAARVPIDETTVAQMDAASAAIAAKYGRSPGPVSALAAAR